MERLTDEQIAEGLKLCAEATPGPWQQNGSHIYGPDPARHLICQMHYIGRGYQEECAANEAVIKSARTLLPAALEELKALRELKQELANDIQHALDRVEDPYCVDVESFSTWIQKLRVL